MSSQRKSSDRGFFTRFAKTVAFASGQPWAFVTAVVVIAVWGISGPLFHFSDTWQLVINTGTTIITFLMVFLIQNTQNRDAQAMQLKLDELIRATKGAHTGVMDLEELTDQELAEIKRAYCTLAEKGRAAMRKGKQDTGTPDVSFKAFEHKPENGH